LRRDLTTETKAWLLLTGSSGSGLLFLSAIHNKHKSSQFAITKQRDGDIYFVTKLYTEYAYQDISNAQHLKVILHYNNMCYNVVDSQWIMLYHHGLQ